MKKWYFISFMCILIGFIVAIGDTVSLFAQEESATEEFTLEEITVTAQKREENQQKVAIAMEVITAEEMKELGRNDINEILMNVSSAIVQKASDGLRVSIRGISDDSSSFYGQSMAAPTVAINTDGVYSNRKDTGGGLYDLERVEVLYGPQSTMYSSNSPGGIVNVITAQPKTDRFEVSGSIEAGSFNLLNLQGAVNIPLAERFAIRTSFSKSKRDGYLDEGGDSEDTKSARLRALFQATEKISITATAEISKDESIGMGGGVKVFIHQDDEYYPDGTELTDPWTSSGGSDTPSTNDSNSKKFSGNVAWDMGFMTATFVPSYTTGDGERTRVMVFGDSVDVSYSYTDRWEKGAELRMASGPDFPFKWILGGTYYDSEDKQDELSAEYIAYGTGKFSFRTNTQKNRALFANVTVPVVGNLRLTGGYRASWDEMVTDNYERTWNQERQEYEIRDENPSQNTTKGRPDIKVGFEYDLAENSMLYGDYSTSYRVQGMSQSSDPQELKAYTLGAKNRFFGNKLQLNTSAYYYDYSNYNVNYRKTIWVDDIDGDNEMDGGGGPGGAPPPMSFSGGSLVPAQADGGTPTSETSNATPEGVTGEGRMLGADLSVSAIITAKDMLNLSVSYIKSEWTDLYFDWTYDYELKLIGGVATQVDLEDTSYNGKPMQNTPPWTINLSYNHNFNLWNGGTLKAGISSRYQTDYRLSWNDDEYPENYQETFHMENANAAYSHPNGMWTLSAYVNNIFNYAEKRMYMNAGGQGQLGIGNP
ncbi:MAG: TonB-dependent receptor, partial [Deltaproteobacteria bacterium]|nr:TonB-dependent receptor [Deltaproteobacteria bacterium]